MKKYLAICTAVLLCIALAGCQAQQSGAEAAASEDTAAMQLSPMTLSEDAARVLDLAGITGSEFVPYEYQAGDTLRCITIQRYILNDALTWEAADSGFYQTYNDTPLAADGSLALTGQSTEGYAIRFSAPGIGDGVNPPALPENLPAAAACGVGAQQQAVPIVYDEEIPLLVRTYRDKSELYVYDAARDFADPSRFAGDLFTEAYTITFSDEMPA